MLFIELKLFFDSFFLSQIALNFILELEIKLIFTCHSFKKCNFSNELILCWSNGGNNATNFRDVISKYNATEEL